MAECTLVQLRPATPDDRRAVYEWMAHSDITSSMMGPPLFSDAPIPTWEEFCADYDSYFFDGSRPEVGRSFIIEHEGEPVGHISYSQMNLLRSFAELDIWLRDSICCGKGFGTNAIKALVVRLHDEFGISEMILRPSARNPRAVRAYEKAGFRADPMSPEDQVRRYGPPETHDTLVLRRTFAD